MPLTIMKGLVSDGLWDSNGDDIIDTGDMPFEPGSAEAKAHFQEIQDDASRTGTYGGRSLEFGAGGRSRLLFDKLVYAENIDPVIAKAIIGRNYIAKLEASS